MIVCVFPVPDGPANMAQWWSRTSLASQKLTEALSPVGTVTSLMFESRELKTISAYAGDSVHAANSNVSVFSQ